MMTSVQPLTPFRADGPFYGMVNTFMASAAGLSPFFDTINPLKPSQTAASVFFGFINPMSVKDMQQFVSQSLTRSMTAAEALNTLCCMLSISAFRLVKGHLDGSPEFQVFDHVRTAAAHRNKFTFRNDEPKLPASWRTFRIDNTRKGNMNPLHGKQCFGTVFGPADLLLLLSDIDKKLP